MIFLFPDSPVIIRKAVCVLQGSVSGTIRFKQFGNGKIRISGSVANLTQGNHGMHVHTYGDLTNGCASTLGHYNPLGNTHGGPSASIRHIGDLGNIFADDNGEAAVNITDSIASLTGATSVVGRAIVVHATVDDLGQGGDTGSLTTGNAGGRLGCCQIKAT